MHARQREELFFAGFGRVRREVAPPDSGGEMGPEQEKFFQEMGKMAEQVS